MCKEKSIVTDRLTLEPLSVNHTDFIFNLVNTPAWIEFIGDKKIYSQSDATAYIQKINANHSTVYWTVKRNNTQTPIGLVTLIKRDYLIHHDLGFAFLPAFHGKGYAYEATKAVLTHLLQKKTFETILAISLPNNIRSINLLQKLGFVFSKQIQNETDVLHLYQTSGLPQ